MSSRRKFLRALGGAAASFPLEILSGQSAPVTVTFTDVAARAGLSAARNVSGDPNRKNYLVELMGCGAAFFDYDNDGWIDIFLVNGSTFPGTGSAAGKRPSNFLFHNNRDGTFTDITVKAGLVHSGWGQGCCIGDYDNDGFDDLFVSYWGRNVLYRNNGDGTFTDVSEKAGVAGDGKRWGAGCCFLDYDRDGLLDLFVANYVQFDPKVAPLPGASPSCIYYNSFPVACGPQGFGGGTNLLYRNRGDGTFEDVSEKSGISNPRGLPAPVFTPKNWRPVGSYGMGAVSADFDNDGWPDIYVACDTAPSLLYRNNRDGTFSEIGAAAGCAFDDNGAALGGMGAGAGDYDGDGWLDIVRTNFSDQVTTLYRNNGDGTFQESSLQAGLGVNKKYLGFGAGFADFDNDGRKDIFLANGHVYPEIARRNLHLSYRQPKLLYRNLGGGRFEDVSARSGQGILAPQVSRGCAFGDFDNDGGVDVLVNNLDGPPSLLRNTGSRGNWILIKCVGTKSNRSAIGARVKVTAGGRTQIDEVMSGSSYYSQNDLRLHFGLGAAAKVDAIEVSWPSGLKDLIRGVPANASIVVVEGSGIRNRGRPDSKR